MSKQITIINSGKMSVVFLYKPVLLHIENLSSSSVFGQHLMDAWLPNVNSDKLVVNKVFARFSLLYIKPFLWCLLHKLSWPQKICLFFMGRSWHPVFSFTQIDNFGLYYNSPWKKKMNLKNIEVTLIIWTACNDL